MSAEMINVGLMRKADSESKHDGSMPTLTRRSLQPRGCCNGTASAGLATPRYPFLFVVRRLREPSGDGDAAI